MSTDEPQSARQTWDGKAVTPIHDRLYRRPASAVRFPPEISYGATAGPEFSTTVITLALGSRTAQPELGGGPAVLRCLHRHQDPGASGSDHRPLPRPWRPGAGLPLQGLVLTCDAPMQTGEFAIMCRNP